MENIIIDQVAFEGDARGYHFKVTYLKEPKRDALVQITKDGKTIREFLFPAYKVFNIAAHTDDIVDGLEQENDSGLFIAGSTGLGGNVFKTE
jgi:hypothetical protein